MYKKFVIDLLRSFAGTIPTKLLIGLTRQRLLLPFYHIISDTPPVHVKHLYAIKGREQFIHDLDFLMQHYTPISVETLNDTVYHQKKLPKNAFLLSFDDGLSECHDIIAPILKRKGIPAIFFLNSAFVDNKALMFRYKASILIDHLEKYPNQSDVLLTVAKKHQFPLLPSTKETLLSVRWQKQPLLDDLAVRLKINFGEFLEQHQPYLTSSQVLSMKQDGFDFGNHSINHPTYFKIPLSEQIYQTVESQSVLNNFFELEKKYFAFPFTDFGVSSTYFDTILKKHNFNLTFGGAGIKKELIQGHLQRIGLEEEINRPARTIIHTAYCYYILKAFLGKNTIHRSDSK